jgi:2-polyprenyl-3-methyl-5-hydroxy-6-metoxy-1,4-benzoquinol methylase
MNYFELRNDTYGDFVLQNHVFEILPLDKNARILDVGCGLCKHLSKLKELGYSNLKGVDVEKSALEACKSFEIEFELITDIVEYSTNHQSEYDFIIMAHVLEHIEKNMTIAVLRAIRSMLKDNGFFYIVVPNGSSNTNCYWAYEDFTHHTLFTSGSLIYVIKAAGFSNFEFLDTDCTAGLTIYKKFLKRSFLKLYTFNYRFWNRVTGSHFHIHSPLIFSFELKAICSK